MADNEEATARTIPRMPPPGERPLRPKRAYVRRAPASRTPRRAAKRRPDEVETTILGLLRLYRAIRP